ncbi:TIGR00159 family protein, partial [Enterococcus faecalis]|nr:TIGR00159 family protein [Enterococcus faecalis]
MSFTQLLQFSNQFWQSLVADPWRIMVNIIDIILVTALMYICIKALSGTRGMALLGAVEFFVVSQWVAT